MKNPLSSLLSIPTYKINIPSSKKVMSFRPFLVKEEKILLISQELQSKTEVLLTIKNIIEACVSGIDDAGDLPLYDLEYIFIKLRSKSVGESVSPLIVCPVTQENVSCSINLDEIEITENKKHTNKIKISNDVTITMQYPTINNIVKYNIDLDKSDENSIYEILISCIKEIETKEEKIDCSLYSKEEIEDFINNLTKAQFNKLINFFETSPKIEKTIEYETTDGIKRSIVLSGFSDFFV